MPTGASDWCCSGIELRTRCIVIGYVQLGSEAILGLGLVYLLAGGYWYGSTALLAFLIVVSVEVSLMLVFTITLLIGLHKDKRKLVRAYILFGCVHVVVGFVSGVIAIIVSFDFGDLMTLWSTTLLQMYILAVIDDHYETMEVEEIPGTVAPNPATPLLASA